MKAETFFAVFKHGRIVALFAEEDHANLWHDTESDLSVVSIARRRVLISPTLSASEDTNTPTKPTADDVAPKDK